jgi:FkbM family methyltransferase
MRIHSNYRNAIRRFCSRTPVLKVLYSFARSRYHNFLSKGAAKRYFSNYDDYRNALHREGEGTVEIRTVDGLTITIRKNIWDARILQEIFLGNPYVRDFTLRADPTIVDIGGYIGDFALYAAKYLKARQVVVYEPSPKNFALLKRNIQKNHYEDRIVAANMAVSDSTEILMNVDLPDRKQVNVSAYGGESSTLKKVDSVTLAGLIELHRLESVDLLKIDCEGGEYAILLSAPLTIFKRIQNIAMEYHEIGGFEAKLEAVITRLKAAGYALKIQEKVSIMSASRA